MFAQMKKHSHFQYRIPDAQCTCLNRFLCLGRYLHWTVSVKCTFTLKLLAPEFQVLLTTMNITASRISYVCNTSVNYV